MYRQIWIFTVCTWSKGLNAAMTQDTENKTNLWHLNDFYVSWNLDCDAQSYPSLLTLDSDFLLSGGRMGLTKRKSEHVN
jgi:hypothetical protein